MQPNMTLAIESYQDLLHDAQKEGADAVKQTMAHIGLNDLFFMLTVILRRMDAQHPWLYERCAEVQRSPNGHLDLWAREHYKSTIITFALTIQDIAWDSEITVGIFSITRPIAKAFAYQIKTECEDNKDLHNFYPNSFWKDPLKESHSWSLDNGLQFPREGNPKEKTIEAWGLVDGMPTSKHYAIRIYDDVIDERNVTNPDIIAKAQKAWELSLSLGSANPIPRYGIPDIERYVGTRYHLNDSYATLIKRNAAKLRKYPGTVDGTPEGEPVMWPKSFMVKKRANMGPYVFACQILQNPVADEVQGFKEDWLVYWDGRESHGMNLYLLCDPANDKKDNSDYTVILVIGLGQDNNYYLIDGIRDRLNLTERTDKMFQFVRMYKPKRVGYERYGKDSDIQHIEYVQEQKNYRFDIYEFGGRQPKNDRIRKLIPVYESRRFFLPRNLYFIDHTKKQRDLVREFVRDEYFAFPLGAHDDILDTQARILDVAKLTTNGKTASSVQFAEFPLQTEHQEDGLIPFHLRKHQQLKTSRSHRLF